MKRWINVFSKGLFPENPILALLLGLCPVLAVSTSATDALGMGIAFSFVLLFSNIIISSLRRFTPHHIRIPIFIVVIATFVTITDYLVAAYSPQLHRNLGVFLPLIVVNCIVLGRAEAFACKNNLFLSFADAVGMGAGFTIVIVLIAVIREVLGAGTIFGKMIMPGNYHPFILMILPPGAFILMAFLIALQKNLAPPPPSSSPLGERKHR